MALVLFSRLLLLQVVVGVQQQAVQALLVGQVEVEVIAEAREALLHRVVKALQAVLMALAHVRLVAVVLEVLD
jgi:hypothetical protein